MDTQERAKLIKCQRSTDCRCWQPMIIEPLTVCPRPPGCTCRFTWSDTHWEKGDPHALCSVHKSQFLELIESPEE
jgi:hypothetical protein